MGYNQFCDPCLNGTKTEEECKCRTVVSEKLTCPPAKMASVPVLTATIVNNFDPNCIKSRHVNEIVVDRHNNKTWFYDIFGVPTLISDDGLMAQEIKDALDNKQNKISDHNPLKSYDVGDIVIKNNELYRALLPTIGELNGEHWAKIG